MGHAMCTAERELRKPEKPSLKGNRERTPEQKRVSPNRLRVHIINMENSCMILATADNRNSE